VVNDWCGWMRLGQLMMVAVDVAKTARFADGRIWGPEVESMYQGGTGSPPNTVDNEDTDREASVPQSKCGPSADTYSVRVCPHNDERRGPTHSYVGIAFQFLRTATSITRDRLSGGWLRGDRGDSGATHG